MSQSFNYRHLYYFWVVAKEGGLTRAAERLDMAVQTISAQVRELERELGHALFKPAGRSLALTEAGVTALHQAEHIFELGQALPGKVREAASGKTMRFVVGISDGVAKLAVQRLLRPILDEPHLRLQCHDGEFEELLAELALHRLDAVISDRASPHHTTMKIHSHLLDSSPIAWYAPKNLAKQLKPDFPHSLTHCPVLLPTGHSALRTDLNHWFERIRVKPNIVGEFEDSALLSTFGSAGMGVFPAAQWMDNYLIKQHGMVKVAVCDDLQDHFHLIYTQRKVLHPLCARLLASGP